MNDDALHELESSLVATGSLRGLAAVPANELDALRGLAEDAVAREDALVTKSLEAAISALPRPLRGRARALLTEDR